MPIHFASRTILGSIPKEEALDKIESVGLAGSSHILLGDATGPIGLERSSIRFQELPPDDLGRVVHANNLIRKYEGVLELIWLEDSPKQTARTQDSAPEEVGKKASFETMLELFKDQERSSASINKPQNGSNDSNTLYNVVYNLTNKNGIMSRGSPTEMEEQIHARDLELTQCTLLLIPEFAALLVSRTFNLLPLTSLSTLTNRAWETRKSMAN